MLPGIAPKEIDSIEDLSKRLEAYTVVYKGFWESINFRRNMSIEAKKYREQIWKRLERNQEELTKMLIKEQDKILELEWRNSCI